MKKKHTKNSKKKVKISENSKNNKKIVKRKFNYTIPVATKVICAIPAEQR